MEIIDIIREERKKKKISQSVIARLIHTTQSNYNEIEHKRNNLKADDMIKICEFLDIPLISFENSEQVTIDKAKYNRIIEITKELVDLLKTQ